MKTRIITGAVLTAVLIPTLIFSHTPLFVIMLALFAFMGEYEMLHCLGLEKNIAISLPAYILAVGLPVGARYITNGMFMQYAFVAIAICFLWMLAAYTFSKGKVTLEQAGGAATGCVYVAVAFTAIILLRDIADTGKYVYMFIFIGAWITDIFAYFTGMLFGKHKLIPEISPKKTIEGSVGGTLFCAVAFVVYGVILDLIGADVSLNYVALIVGGLLAAIVSQIGDLMFSAIKRSRGIKDYGKIFPGHGGVLDRFDSALAVAVILLAIESCVDLL